MLVTLQLRFYIIIKFWFYFDWFKVKNHNTNTFQVYLWKHLLFCFIFYFILNFNKNILKHRINISVMRCVSNLHENRVKRLNKNIFDSVYILVHLLQCSIQFIQLHVEWMDDKSFRLVDYFIVKYALVNRSDHSIFGIRTVVLIDKDGEECLENASHEVVNLVHAPLVTTRVLLAQYGQESS